MNPIPAHATFSGAAGFPDEMDVEYIDDGAFQDGNVLAGPLSEIFAVDVTAAVGQCAGCGNTGPVAQLRVYGAEAAMVARCPHCASVVMRLVRGAEAAWLDMRGTVNLRIPLPTA